MAAEEVQGEEQVQGPPEPTADEETTTEVLMLTAGEEPENAASCSWEMEEVSTSTGVKEEDDEEEGQEIPRGLLVDGSVCRSEPEPSP